MAIEIPHTLFFRGRSVARRVYLRREGFVGGHSHLKSVTLKPNRKVWGVNVGTSNARGPHTARRSNVYKLLRIQPHISSDSPTFLSVSIPFPSLYPLFLPTGSKLRKQRLPYRHHGGRRLPAECDARVLRASVAGLERRVVEHLDVVKRGGIGDFGAASGSKTTASRWDPICTGPLIPSAEGSLPLSNEMPPRRLL